MRAVSRHIAFLAIAMFFCRSIQAQHDIVGYVGGEPILTITEISLKIDKEGGLYDKVGYKKTATDRNIDMVRVQLHLEVSDTNMRTNRICQIRVKSSTSSQAMDNVSYPYSGDTILSNGLFPGRAMYSIDCSDFDKNVVVVIDRIDVLFVGENTHHILDGFPKTMAQTENTADYKIFALN